MEPLYIYLIFVAAACAGTAIYIAYIKKQGKTATEKTQQISAPVVNKQVAQLIRNQKKLEARFSDLQVAVRLQPDTPKQKGEKTT
jgi:hypothetical protein